MEAIILAGGLGTRLKDVISDVPKPMAPVMGKPFLQYLLDHLHKQEVSRVILSVGFKHQVIEDYFKTKYKDISILYSVENEPLGTGGGIKKALKKTIEQHVFILNGDTYFNVNLKQLCDKHLRLNSDITLSLKPMKDFDRYGSVVALENRIIGFEEKKYLAKGNINGGVYMFNTTLFDRFELPDRFSFENDFLAKYLDKLNINAFLSNAYFIDIGVPEDYRRAQKELVAQK